jgi:DNA-binding NtrC family response regulator
METLDSVLHSGPILLLQRKGRVSAKALREGEAVVIGRSPNVHVCVDDPQLSRRHLQVFLKGTDVFVEDLRSTNGTFVDHTRLEGRRALMPDATVRAGDAVIRIQGLEDWRARCSELASHEAVEAALQRAVRGRGSVSVLAFRPPPQAPLLEWSRRLVTTLPNDAVVAHYAGSTLEAVCPRLDGPRLERLVQPLVLHTGARAGLASWPTPVRDAEGLVSVALTALESTSSKAPLAHGASESGTDILAEDPLTLELLQTVRRMADSHATVLVSGETGAGKEVVARAIHDLSPRKGPFVAVNCGAIAPTLLESHLFGHERGAFTGADQARAGVFRDADGGTLFLDEIGDLPLAAQVALLRVLETRTVTPVGSSRSVPVDVRVVAASHRDLRSMADEGSFRWDLLYRLEVLSLEVPPLRDRPRDILPLARHFLDQARALHGSRVEGFDGAAERCLQGYHWPGNVRELRNVVERATVLARAPRIAPVDLPDRVRADLRPTTDEVPALGEDTIEPTDDFGLLFPEWTLAEYTERLEAALLRRALLATKHNQSEAARVLQLPRRTLVYKLARLPLEEHVDEADLCLAVLEERADAGLDHRDRLATLVQRLVARLHRQEPDVAVLAERLAVTPRTVKSKLKG